MTAKTWAFEDFVEGASFDLGTKHVSTAEIIDFASEFDAQPMHLDEEAGKARDEGKEYVVQDGDVMLFKFNT